MASGCHYANCILCFDWWIAIMWLQAFTMQIVFYAVIGGVLSCGFRLALCRLYAVL